MREGVTDLAITELSVVLGEMPYRTRQLKNVRVLRQRGCGNENALLLAKSTVSYYGIDGFPWDNGYFGQ